MSFVRYQIDKCFGPYPTGKTMMHFPAMPRQWCDLHCHTRYFKPQILKDGSWQEKIFLLTAPELGKENTRPTTKHSLNKTGFQAKLFRTFPRPKFGPKERLLDGWTALGIPHDSPSSKRRRNSCQGHLRPPDEKQMSSFQ